MYTLQRRNTTFDSDVSSWLGRPAFVKNYGGQAGFSIRADALMYRAAPETALARFRRRSASSDDSPHCRPFEPCDTKTKEKCPTTVVGHFSLAPRVGIEPTTVALTGRRSTAELPGNGFEIFFSVTAFQFFLTDTGPGSRLKGLFVKQAPRSVSLCRKNQPRIVIADPLL